MAIEQKDIDRLLICRAVIDKQRAFNAASNSGAYGAQTVINQSKVNIIDAARFGWAGGHDRWRSHDYMARFGDFYHCTVRIGDLC